MRLPEKWQPTVFSLTVYALSRVMLLGALAVAREMGTPNPSFTSLVVRWDATYYLPITRDGYSTAPGDVHHAFFPLYPMLSRAANVVLPGSAFASSVFVSVVAGAIAAVLVWYVAARLAGPEHSNAAVMVFCFFPGTVVFGWPYADSLLLALVAGSVLLLTQRHWLWASGVAAFATATKPGALALALACAVAAWQQTEGRRRIPAFLTAGAISSLGFVLYMGYLWQRTDRLSEWWDVERKHFQEGQHPDRVLTTLKDIFRDAASFNRTIVILFAAIAITLLVFGLLAKQPAWAKVLTVVATYFTLTANIASASPRFALVALPAVIALAAKLKNDALVLWCAASAALSFALVILYTTTILAAP